MDRDLGEGPELILVWLACTSPDPEPGPEPGDSMDSQAPELEPCEDGTTRRPFLSEDLTVATTTGDWTLSEHWSGCDSFLFLGIPPSGSYLSTLMDEDPKKLFKKGPRDVEYVFFADGADAHRDDLAEMLDLALSDLNDGDQAHWADRVHIATGRSAGLDGSYGEYVAGVEYPVFGVDREGALREVGYLADPHEGWETTNWEYLGDEAALHAFEAAREDTLVARDATVLRLWDGVEVGSEEWGAFSTDLTDAAAGHNRVDVDITLGCGGPWYDACPAWDTVNWLFVCDQDGEDCVELARLVTGYWRGGRWVMDGTQVLDRLQGPASFTYSGGQVKLVTVDLRFWSDGTDRAPLASNQVWWDNDSFWTDEWVAAHQDHAFTPPADATRVELVHAITGHGSDSEGCAEFCASSHAFHVNGTEFRTDFDDAGSRDGCRDRVGTAGVLPNQAGTWTYGRAGWCPGQGVEPVRVDITSAVTLGEANELDYTALFGEESARNTDANFDPSVFLVYSK
ncbi:MAG: hypothetical protein GY913_22165 [Proteobacteria bacterium]|nr:hypothetical protein [Pseudomonadota bacterium]MCP4919617.1 hypothetical protein [Pseudomonadota bacterium]